MRCAPPNPPPFISVASTNNSIHMAICSCMYSDVPSFKQPEKNLSSYMAQNLNPKREKVPAKFFLHPTHTHLMDQMRAELPDKFQSQWRYQYPDPTWPSKWADTSETPSTSLPFPDIKNILWNKLKYVLSQETAYFTMRDRMPPKSLTTEKYRIQAHMLSRRDSLNMPEMGQALMDSELDRIVLTVTAALMHPYHVPWDVTSRATRVKRTRVRDDGLIAESDTALDKFFESCKFGLIDKPAVILDIHGVILAWYLPDIISQSRIDELNDATIMLNPLLKSSIDYHSKHPNWRVDPRKFHKHQIFEPGAINLTPGWFLQGKERLQDPIVPSESFRQPETRQWLERIHRVELLFNGITALTSVELYNAGVQAAEKIQSVISNRITDAHRDRGGCDEWYDLLVSAGTHSKALLQVRDIGADFVYGPGTVITICGRVLSHEVPAWIEGERLCYAHYMRQMVNDRLGVQKAGWVIMQDYSQFMNRVFKERQNII